MHLANGKQFGASYKTALDLDDVGPTYRFCCSHLLIELMPSQTSGPE